MISAATYFLIQNPDAWNKVAAEIRGAFETEKDMTDAKLDKLPYFGAVTKEVLRMAPPLTFGHPRVVPQGGRTVAGHWLPEGVSTASTSHIPCDFVLAIPADNASSDGRQCCRLGSFALPSQLRRP